jgi:hypothetical protein
VTTPWRRAPCGGHQHLPQGGKAALRPVLLDEPEHGVDEQHHRDDDRVLEVADEAGEHGRTHEHGDQHVAELVDEELPWRPAADLRQLVAAVAGEAGGDLAGLEPPAGVDVEALGRLGAAEDVPALPGRRVVGSAGRRSAPRARRLAGRGRGMGARVGDGLEHGYDLSWWCRRRSLPPHGRRGRAVAGMTTTP